jgi:hypothetical protein
MPKRPRDVNSLAKQIVDEATGEAERKQPAEPSRAAVNRGKARAAALSAKRRSEIARDAALARWARRSAEGDAG